MSETTGAARKGRPMTYELAFGDIDTVHRAGCAHLRRVNPRDVVPMEAATPEEARAEYVEMGFEEGALGFAPCTA